MIGTGERIDEQGALVMHARRVRWKKASTGSVASINYHGQL